MPIFVIVAELKYFLINLHFCFKIMVLKRKKTNMRIRLYNYIII